MKSGFCFRKRFLLSNFFTIEALSISGDDDRLALHCLSLTMISSSGTSLSPVVLFRTFARDLVDTSSEPGCGNGSSANHILSARVLIATSMEISTNV